MTCPAGVNPSGSDEAQPPLPGAAHPSLVMTASDGRQYACALPQQAEGQGPGSSTRAPAVEAREQTLPERQRALEAQLAEAAAVGAPKPQDLLEGLGGWPGRVCAPPAAGGRRSRGRCRRA
jgi:hypothetical protein